MAAQDDFAAQVARLERSIDEIEETLAGERLESARTLVRAVLDVHRAAISDLLTSLRAAGMACPREVTRRPAVAWLLSLHDLSSESAAEQAEVLAPQARLEFDDPFDNNGAETPYLVPPERLVRRALVRPR